MEREQESGYICEICGETHPTESHRSTKIVAKFSDTPTAPRVDELDRMRKEKIVVEPAQAGWDTLSALSKRLLRARESLDTLIAPQRLPHPEWFAVRRKIRAGSLAEHFHPDLIAHIEEQLAEPPLEDWLPATSFGPQVTRIATTTARIHPKLCRPFVAPDGPVQGQLILYYSPEFLSAMREWVQEQHSREFSEETTRQQLDVEYGLAEPRPVPPYRELPEYWQPYGSKEAVDRARDRILEKFDDDLREDSGRQHRARKAVQKTIRDLEQTRMEEDGRD